MLAGTRGRLVEKDPVLCRLHNHAPGEQQPIVDQARSRPTVARILTDLFLTTGGLVGCSPLVF